MTKEQKIKLELLKEHFDTSRHAQFRSVVQAMSHVRRDGEEIGEAIDRLYEKTELYLASVGGNRS